MKGTTNLFTKWKHGQLALPKVYLIRIYYEDNSGNSQTCLKLGRTKQPLHDRVIRFLREMRTATGFKIKQYEVISILNNSNSTGIEYGLHSNVPHLSLYNGLNGPIRFSGSSELLQDTPKNCGLIQNPDSNFVKGKYVIPYNFIVSEFSTHQFYSNVV